MVSLATPRGAMLPPPTPLSKRPTPLKRDSSYLDTDDEAGLSASTKKLKVAFDPNVDIRIVEDWSEKSFELVKEEVRLGIERHLAHGDRRDDTQYIKLLQLLGQDAGSDEAPSTELLKKYLLAIEAKISSLGECGKLVAAVLSLQWLGRDDIFAGLYIRFLTTLATAQSKFTSSIMEKLVSNFARLPASQGRIPGAKPTPRATMYKRVHTAIKTLLRQMPSATAILLRTLVAEFPNDLATTRSYFEYQKHLVRLGVYTPEIHAQVMSLLTQRLVGIDVQIQLDLEDLDEEEQEKLLQQYSKPKNGPAEADDSDDSDDDSVSESEETMTDEEQRIRELRLKLAKMDNTMELLFGFYTPRVQDGLKAELNAAYQQLISHFETFIMPNRTRHAQFLVFHFSQTLPEHARVFAHRCLQIAFEGTSSASLRLHACAYLASFVARGAHLETSLVQEIFGFLCQELESMRKRYESTCRGPDKRSYSVYYALAQAILYVFCFRWRDVVTGAETPEDGDEDMSEDDLLADGRELAWLPGVKEALQKSIHSRLNPLKVCSPAIVGEFAKIAHHVRFLYVFSILETNKRVRLGNAYVSRTASDIGRRETAIDRKLGEAHLQLEAYFPFDPYGLPVSKRWVEGDYNEWKLPAGMRQDDDDADDESEEDESDDDSLPDEEVDDLPAVDSISVSS